MRIVNRLLVLGALLSSACGGDTGSAADASVLDANRIDTAVAETGADATTAADGTATDTIVTAPDATRRDSSIDGNIDLDAFTGDAALTGATEYFVWSLFDVPATPANQQVPGFNLDGYESPIAGGINCEQNQPDLIGLDGTTRGIDNAFSTRVTTIDNALRGFNQASIGDSIKVGIRTGRAIILMAVRGIDSYANDNEVIVTFHQHQPLVGPDGGVSNPPNIVWDNTRGILFASGFSAGPPLAVARGSISNAGGNGSFLYLQVPSLRVPVYARGTGASAMTYYVNVRDAELRAQFLSATVGGGLGNGNLGGSVAVSEMLTVFVAAANNPLVSEQTLDALFGIKNTADMYPGGDDRCQNISVGVTFRAIPTTISNFAQ